MNTIKYKYKKTAVNVFDADYCMSPIDAKYFIDDAYAKRDRLKALVKQIRDHGCVNSFNGVVCLHTKFLEKAYEDYRRAQRLSVAAYRKCLADMERA